MITIKITKGFFTTKTEVAKAKAAERRIAKSQLKKIEKIEVVDAWQFYFKNPWVKAKGINKTTPAPGQQMIIVYYKNETKPMAEKQTKPTTIQKVSKPQPTRPIIIDLTAFYFLRRIVSKISSGEFKQSTHISPSIPRRIEFIPHKASKAS